ncbi:hypothetical protein AMR72_11115 [Flavobacterium psychrophilum]|nr:hypothetical protein AMR72_11115 [Flavobacterium psychrophilum]AOE53013.1 hypothetical protein ALW18_11105 [Flavobacterium psychrophilum]
MHNYILFIGLMAAFMFFLIDKNLLPGTLIAKKQILERLASNKQRDVELRTAFENLVAFNSAWSLIAFPDSDVTYAEYIDLLNEKASMEYADLEFENLRSRRLNRRETADYLEKIKGQEDALQALQADLNFQKKQFRQVTLLSAS